MLTTPLKTHTVLLLKKELLLKRMTKLGPKVRLVKLLLFGERGSVSWPSAGSTGPTTRTSALTPLSQCRRTTTCIRGGGVEECRYKETDHLHGQASREGCSPSRFICLVVPLSFSLCRTESDNKKLRKFTK